MSVLVAILTNVVFRELILVQVDGHLQLITYMDLTCIKMTCIFSIWILCGD